MRRRLSYSNVCATLALFVALGGTGYAAVKLPKNSVGAKQIRKNAVRASEIKAGAVGTSEVKDGSLTGKDISLAGLGKVPSAGSADTAGAAGTAANAATLGGLTGNQLVRAAHGEVFTSKSGGTHDTLNDFTPGSDAGGAQSIETKSVTAPTNGVLMIWTSVDFERDGNAGATNPALDTFVNVDGARASTEASATVSTANADMSTANSTAVPVSAGGHTVDLRGYNRGDGFFFIFDRSITTLFVPYGNDGSVGGGLRAAHAAARSVHRNH
jgi:hypothetical protein